MNRKKSKESSRVPRDPVLELYFSNKTRRAAIALLKEKRTYGDAQALLPKLGVQTMHRDLRLALLGNLKPSNWNDVIISPILPPSTNWLQELGWLAHGFQFASSQLNSFLRLRQQFGKAYLLGDYEKANSIISSISTEHGLSLWLAERELMLIQASAGFEAHKQRLSEIQSRLTNSLVGYFITISSNRLEPHVTPEAFQRSSKQDLEEIREDGHDAFASWVELHIAPWSFDWLKDKHKLLQYCWGKALVDRYDRVIKILSCIQLSTLDQKEQKQLRSILDDLAGVIDDRQIKHLVGMLEPDRQTVDVRTDQYFNALDSLVSGDYVRCAELAEKLIIEDPTCFEFYWLLARATASCAQSFIANIPDHSVARAISHHLLQIAVNRVAINIPLAELNSIAFKLGDNHLGVSLRQFIQYEETGLYDKSATSQMVVQNKIDVFSQRGSHGSLGTMGIVGTSLTTYSNHICVQLELYESGASPNVLNSEIVALPFAAISNAKRKSLKGDHQGVLRELTILLDDDEIGSNEVLIHGVVVARLQFEALIGLDDAESAARAITRHYLRNPNNLRHVPFERLIEGCLAGQWPFLRKLPCWPILMTLNNGTEQDVYEAVDDLLLEHGCTSPLSIANGEIPCSVDELRIILRDILIPKVISRGALWNRTAEERRQMRMQLLQRLYAISLADQEFVVEELSLLEQAQLLEAAYRDIEGPKFELDYNSVNRDMAKLFEGTFARFSEYRNYEAKGGTLTSEGELLTSAREGAEIKATTERKAETSELLLRQISRAAFIQYLLDTSSGINAFLGTRIRHGSLENQLTRVLGAHSLLALKNSAGLYVCDSSVQEHLRDVAAANRESATKAYVEFTHTINALVSSLVTSVLRIRLPEGILNFWERQGVKTSELRSDIGLLDFSRLFSDEVTLQLDEREFSSISSLLSEAERMFVLEANLAFDSVREYFERNVAEEIGASLQRLEDAIQAALPEGTQRVALRAEILAAKGEYSEDLNIISTWFSAAKPTEAGLGSLGNIIEMAGRVVNFASNGRLGDLVIGDFHDVTPAIEGGRLMYEVISIMLRNVVQHSRIDIGQEVIFEHRIEREKCCLVLRNRVCDEQECDSLVRRAEEAIARPFDDWALGTAPGGTGFVRIRKLLRQAGFSKVEFVVRRLSSPCQFEAEIYYAV